MICGYKQEGLRSDSHVLSHEKDRDLRLRMNKKTEEHCVETFKKHLPPPLRAQVKVPAKISEWVPVLPFTTPGQLARETSGNERVVDMFTVDALKKISEAMEAYRMRWLSPEEAFMRVHVLRLEADARADADLKAQKESDLLEEVKGLRVQIQENAEIQSQRYEAELRNHSENLQRMEDYARERFEQGQMVGMIEGRKRGPYKRRSREVQKVAQEAEGVIESQNPGVADDLQRRVDALLREGKSESATESESESESASTESSSDSDPEGLMRRVREPTPEVEVVVNPLNQLFSP